jgi:hypothetical protein
MVANQKKVTSKKLQELSPLQKTATGFFSSFFIIISFRAHTFESYLLNFRDHHPGDP